VFRGYFSNISLNLSINELPFNISNVGLLPFQAQYSECYFRDEFAITRFYDVEHLMVRTRGACGRCVRAYMKDPGDTINFSICAAHYDCLHRWPFSFPPSPGS
jgi:hypothetical protein